MTATDQLATKQDVEEIVGRVVGEVAGQILQLMASQFDKVNKRLDAMDKRFDAMDKRFDRLEDKLESTVDTVDHHSIDIRRLQRKTA